MNEPKSTKHVALLRGVNVGGVKVLMAPLRDIAENLGWTNVKTYIASGNLLFSARGKQTELAEQLRASLKAHIGVDTPVMVLSAKNIRSILNKHPWNPKKGNQSHVYFCWNTPEIDHALYSDVRSKEEELQIVDGHIHFYAPAGLGQSKLAGKLGAVVQGTEMTGRNLNTVRKIVDMLSN